MVQQSLDQYFNLISRYPLLTAAEEINLSRQIKAWQSVECLYFDKEGNAIADENGNAIQLLPEHQKLKDFADQAVQKFVNSNLRLVVKVAKQFFHRIERTALEPLDLLQEGAIGLVTAALKFDHTKGFRFSTYSYNWVRQAIGRFIDNSNRSVRLPIHISASMTKIKQAYKALDQASESTSFDAIAAYINKTAKKPNWTAKKVEFILRSSTLVYSLDSKINPKEERSPMLLDSVSVNDGDGEERLVQEAIAEEVQRAFDYLSPNEVQVIRARFGFDTGGVPVSLREIAVRMNLSKQRVAQVEQKAMRTMRTAMKRRYGMSKDLLAS